MRWLAALVILAAPAASAQPAPEIVSKAAAKARSELEARLLDYPSARFADVKAHVADGGKAVLFCGKVNAKNRSGGYVGWEGFAAFVTDSATVTAGASDAPMTAIYCSEPIGYPVPGDFSAAMAHR